MPTRPEEIYRPNPARKVRPHEMTPDEMAAVRDAFGLTYEKFERLGQDLTGEPFVDGRTIRRWQTDGVSRIAALLFEILLRSPEARKLLGLKLDASKLPATMRRRLGLGNGNGK